jgi:hypothetical protein
MRAKVAAGSRSAATFIKAVRIKEVRIKAARIRRAAD